MSNLSPRTPEPGSAEAVKSRAFDDATPLRRPRRSFRQTLVVLDPWIAISASIPWLFAVYALKSGADFNHHGMMMGENDWSLFAWCWRIDTSAWLTFMGAAGSIILIAVACAPSGFRRWIYAIYLPIFAVAYAVSWAARAYLESQMQGVWRCCLPYGNGQEPSSLLILVFMLIISNPATTILLIRLATPNLTFAGPKDKA